MLTLINPSNFRQAILFSTLTERPIVIEGIREDLDISGITDYESKFLQLFELIQNGCRVQISQSGKRIKYHPGVIINNEVQLDFDCGNTRSLTYFLEYLCIAALFGKCQLNINLQGITNDELDISIDNYIYSILAIFKKFDCEINIKILKRGFKPNGNGSINLITQPIKTLKSVNLSDIGRYTKIRGSVFGGKISPQFLNRMISGAREILNNYLPDVWIYSDLSKNCESSYYGIALMAESDKGSLLIADEGYEKDKSQLQNQPENIGKQCAQRLLDELFYVYFINIQSGYVDSQNQALVFILMSLSERKISKVSVKRLSDFGAETLRMIKTFLGVQFHFQSIENENENQQYTFYSCMGLGLSNLSRILK